ncbi:MAG: DUF1080 domain-containing protein [Candidatus Hinthialibacter antarcticus]|nr:DUF1080 domain-containing protein [Candidatus Hinthialibacter antarcticus]
MVRNIVLSILSLMVCCFVLSTQAEPVKVLLITGGHEFDEKEFFEVFSLTPDIVYRHVAQPGANEMFASGEAMKYDVAVLYDMWPKITDAQKEGYLEFLRAGKGIVATHHCAASYPEWTGFVDLIGGMYVLQPIKRHGKTLAPSAYKHEVHVPVKIADKNHPITQGLSDFTIFDETYKDVYVHPDSHVLLTTDEPTSTPQLAWAIDHAPGRAAYIQLGHDKHAFQNESYRRLISNAIAWADHGASDNGWVSLFDGKTLDGWKQVNGTAKYSVKDQTIIGWTVEGSPNSFLCTTRNYGDFALEFEVKVDTRLNSGVQVRSESKSDYQNGRVHGYQVEIAVNGLPGYVYDEARRSKFINENTDRKKAMDAFHDGEWNHYRVVCKGDLIQTWINGVPLEHVNDSMTKEGFIGLQVHSFNGETPAWVQWKNIRIKEL